MFQPLEHKLFIMLERHPNFDLDTQNIVHDMAPQKRQASQHEASRTRKQKTGWPYSTNPKCDQENEAP